MFRRILGALGLSDAAAARPTPPPSQLPEPRPEQPQLVPPHLLLPPPPPPPPAVPHVARRDDPDAWFPSLIEVELPPARADSVYDQDALFTSHNHDFMRQPSFIRAYERGMRAVGKDYKWHWRVYIGLCAAAQAARHPGDFVECGVNSGFLSSSIMEFLDWNNQGRTFYLLDTFAGIDERYVSEEERAQGILEKNAKTLADGFYTTDLEAVRRNFSEWRNVEIIQGAVPETLSHIRSEQIAFASIDMNCSPPEVAAMECLWARLVPGAMVVLDDYAYGGYREQKVGMDRFARAKKVPIFGLPTGQGLIVKP